MIDQNILPQNTGFYWFFGVVECTNDPEKMGRVMVRAIGDHTQDLDEIPREDLPWALPMMPVNSAFISGIGNSPTGLVKGSHVVGFYRDGAHKQQPVIIGSIGGIPIDPPDPTIGFNDPQECFPDITKLEEPDTNRLARGVAGKHVKEHLAVTTRRNTVLKGIWSAASKWDEPETPYEAIYPYNKVWEGPYNPECDECEWGHIEEWDSTPGAERYFRQHKTSQNFLEIHPDGKEVRKIYGPSFEINLASKHILIDGDYQVTIQGNKEERIKGDYMQVIDGDYSQVVTGNKILHTFEDEVQVVQGAIYRLAKDTITDVTEAGYNLAAADAIDMMCGTDFTALAGTSSSIAAGSGISPSVPGKPGSDQDSPSYENIILSCKEENKAKSAKSGLVVPDIPSAGVGGGGAGGTYVKAHISSNVYVKATNTHNTGHLYIPNIDCVEATITTIDGIDLTYTSIDSTDIMSGTVTAISASAGNVITSSLTSSIIYGIIAGPGMGESTAQTSSGEIAIPHTPTSAPFVVIAGDTPAIEVESEIEYAEPFIPGEIYPPCP
jgi:hypothetical protein